jgi:hypothetical protein
MIRLKHILLEEKQIPNVLFISDNGTDKRKGYARKLISNSIVTGEIYTADNQPSEELVSLVYYNISSGYYDAIVIQCSGLFDDTAQEIIDNLTLIDDICKRKKIEPIYISIPTDQFIKSDDYTPIDRLSVNNWIRNRAHVSLSNIKDDIYFSKGGMRLDKEGQQIIYNKLKNIFMSFADDETTDVEDKLRPKNLRKLQHKLNKLGYTIDSKETDRIKLGDSTKDSIKQFQLKNGLTPTGELDKQTIVKLLSITAIAADSGAEVIKKSIKSKKSKGERTTATVVMDFLIDKGLSIAGAAGIAGNMQVESQFRTDILGDKGTSIGLVQWHADRKDALFSWCKKKGLDALSLNAQLQFLWFEMTTKFSSLTNDLKTIEDPQEAAYQFADEFENPAVISPKRKEYAQQFFDEYSEGGLSTTLKSLAIGTTLGLASIFNTNDTNVGRDYFGPGTGKLPGTDRGGIGGDWAGSLPKLISVLPAGTWIAGQKRARKTTKGGSVSDHYFGNANSYACDFMLDKAFNNDKTAATNFAIAIAQNAGKNITSWKPYINSYLNINTPDGYRVQIIWLSMVGGNHYDHVHVGVRKLNKK